MLIKILFLEKFNHWRLLLVEKIKRRDLAILVLLGNDGLINVVIVVGVSVPVQVGFDLPTKW